MNQSFKLYLFKGFDWLFPRRCFGCRKTNQPEKIPNLCIFCWNQMFRPQRVVFPNRPKLHIFASGTYDQLLKRAIILAKFKHHPICSDFLFESMFETLKQIHFPIDIITSIPGDYWRCLKRGVDLPALLAQELSKRNGIEFRTDLLKKRRNPDRQQQLNKDARKENMKDVFWASPELQGKNILVIDDIITTGNTILSCFRTVRTQKPANVVFLTAAKTRY